MADFPKSVLITEHGPREGFQIEKGPIPTHRKVELIDALSNSGLKRIQVCSFVSPKRVPTWADADQVVEQITARPGVQYVALWFNEKGLTRALATKKLTLEGCVRIYASAAFTEKNLHWTQQQLLDEDHHELEMNKRYGIKTDYASITAVWGCNFEGDIPDSTVLDYIKVALDIAAEHGETVRTINLSDTMAWATPYSVKRLCGAIREKFPELNLSLHLHDTRGMGIANAYAGLEMGVSRFDSSVAGLGGCPFAAHKGAAGNVCTDDLVFMCDEMGIETGVDLEALAECARLAEDVVGHPLPGAVMHGGSLKRLRAAVQAAKAA